MQTFRVLSALLTYPEAALCAATGELEQVLAAEGLLPAAERRALDRLLTELATGDLLDLQERYVGLFDRVPSLSLHLFGHVHGDSRDRGQAMVDLLELYRQHGLVPSTSELPDFLPLYLEFLAERPLKEAQTMLGDVAHIVAGIHARLLKRNSSYAAATAGLLALAGKWPELPDVSGDDDSFEALDRAWEDREVRFTADDAETSSGCDKATAIIQRMNAPQPEGRP